MLEFLEGFEKRMGFAAVVDSIVNRKNKNSEIEDWFGGEELDNVFFSLLVYIMEQTLNENDDCTIEKMAGFLDDTLPAYGKDFSFDQILRLTEYMVRDILQNKGTARTYAVMHYDKGMVQHRVRLIEDKMTDEGKIVYQLTDQGYDFLFRTKEIDRELDFKLEQLKLKELLKRKNYKHALKQSRELISMLRQKKREIQSFVDRIRENIHTIDRGEHEELLKQTYHLIDQDFFYLLPVNCCCPDAASVCTPCQLFPHILCNCLCIFLRCQSVHIHNICKTVKSLADNFALYPHPKSLIRLDRSFAAISSSVYPVPSASIASVMALALSVSSSCVVDAFRARAFPASTAASRTASFAAG